MPLYEVTKTYYVWAENKFEAEMMRADHTSSCDNEVVEIKKDSPILAHWMNAIPFSNRKDDKTCKELRDES